jgi:hypothetical protein
MKVDVFRIKTYFSFAALLLATMLVVFGCGGSGGGGGNDNGSGGNSAPVAVDSAISVARDTVYNGSLSASDADGDAMTFTIAANPNMGSITITDVATGQYTYTPNSGLTGSDSFTFYASDGQQNSNTATVTVSITENNPPTADALENFSADELSTVTLTGTGSDTEDGASVSYSWTQTAGPVQVTLLNADTATAQFAAPAVETGASLLLSFRLTVTDSANLTAEDTVEVTINAAGHIIGSVISDPDYRTNLTEQGTLDWAVFGYDSNTSFHSKAGGTDELSNYEAIGSVTPIRSEGGPVTFWWEDGPAGAEEPTKTEPGQEDEPNLNGSKTRVRFQNPGVGNGIRLRVPAGVEDRILRVYFGAYSHKGRVTVSLENDASVTPYTVSLDCPDEFQKVWAVTILFGAANNGDQLLIDYVVEDDSGGDGGHINLAAVSLTEAQSMTPSFFPLPGTYTDAVSLTLGSAPNGAAIRYTQDGSQPTTSSPGYTGAVTLTETNTVNARAYYPGFNNSSVASGSYVIDTTATGTLAATVAKSTYDIDLTQEGTRDWIAFGYLNLDGNNESFITKTGVTNELANYGKIGEFNALRSLGSPVLFSWSDGPASDPTLQTNTRIMFPQEQGLEASEGIRLTIPADDVEKTLKVYLGAYSMEGIVTVSMEDGSVPAYTTTLSSVLDEIHETWVVTVDFAAPSGSQSNLIVEYLRGADVGVPNGHINIAAATLAD